MVGSAGTAREDACSVVRYGARRTISKEHKIGSGYQICVEGVYSCHAWP